MSIASIGAAAASTNTTRRRILADTHSRGVAWFANTVAATTGAVMTSLNILKRVAVGAIGCAQGVGFHVVAVRVAGSAVAVRVVVTAGTGHRAAAPEHRHSACAAANLQRRVGARRVARHAHRVLPDLGRRAHASWLATG